MHTDNPPAVLGPGDPGYDPRTLYIPPAWYKEKKVSEAQQQWWKFKAANFDSVLLFKVGKFYEVCASERWPCNCTCNACIAQHCHLKAEQRGMVLDGPLGLLWCALLKSNCLLSLGNSHKQVIHTKYCGLFFVPLRRCLRWTRMWVSTSWPCRS